MRKLATDKLLPAVDLFGTFVFAVEGAMTAIRGHLDFFGVLVLAFATALGGGILRDLLIGATPPASIQDRRYPIMAFVGGTIAFCLYPWVLRVPDTLLITLDAAGLGLFAVSGAAKALDYKIEPFMAALMGTLTGVGGGTLRDLLLARVPGVLRVDIYAVAALLGSAVMITGIRKGLPRTPMMVLGGILCFLLRIISVWRHWHLPRIPGP